MDNIRIFLKMIMTGMQHEFNVYGYNISLWKIFVSMTLVNIFMAIIGGVLHGDD